jgi:hypothetical protein
MSQHAYWSWILSYLGKDFDLNATLHQQAFGIFVNHHKILLLLSADKVYPFIPEESKFS